MAFDFPANPILGQTFTPPGSTVTYTWNSYAWDRGAGLGVGGTAPYVLKAGDTMVGFLTANADPTAPMHYATKQYIDTLVAGLLPLGTPGQAYVINPSSAPQWGAPIDGENF